MHCNHLQDIHSRGFWFNFSSETVAVDHRHCGVNLLDFLPVEVRKDAPECVHKLDGRIRKVHDEM